MAYEMVMPYHLHMPSYFLETFTEYPSITIMLTRAGVYPQKVHCTYYYYTIGSRLNPFITNK